MLKKTLEKKQKDILWEIEEIEKEAINLNDKLHAVKFCWERKIKKLRDIGYNIEYTFEDIIE